MYKRAVRKKLTGGIIALILTLAFFIFVIIVMEDVPLYLFGGFLGVFVLLIGYSLIKYVIALGTLKEQYGEELASDIDYCEKHCSDKYFFFDDCMIDLANARLIYYSEIVKISGLSTKAHRSPSTGHISHAGAVVEMTMDSGKHYLFADFGTSSVKDSKNTLDNYHKFCDYLAEYAPWAAEEKKILNY